METKDFSPAKRNEHGLIEGINYEFLPNNRVNWRALVSKEHLVVNKVNFEKRGAAIPENIDSVEDKDKLILLEGFKEILNLRGYSKLVYPKISSSPNHCSVVCEITWTPNFETENREVTFSGIGDATLDSTRGFGRFFLGPIAENRAFVRCVRNFLGIKILGKDEVDGVTESEPAKNTTGPTDNIVERVDALMKQKGLSFDTVKKKLVSENIPNSDKFNSLNDIPKNILFDLIGRFQKLKDKA